MVYEFKDGDSVQVIWELSSRYIVSIASGDRHALALSHEGRVFSWGTSARGESGWGTTRMRVGCVWELDIPDRVVSISARRTLSCCMTESGQVWYWGDRHYYVPHRMAHLVNSDWEKYVDNVSCGASQIMVGIDEGRDPTQRRAIRMAISFNEMVENRKIWNDRMAYTLKAEDKRYRFSAIYFLKAAFFHTLILFFFFLALTIGTLVARESLG